MSSHPIGQQLRRLVLQDHQRGQAPDPRRLQAAIGDLCGAEHSDLVAPLRYLVLSRAFTSAASQEPPLSDGRLLQRLQEELSEMYAPPLCARLQPVLEGLLGLPATPQPGHWRDQRSAIPQANSTTTGSAPQHAAASHPIDPGHPGHSTDWPATDPGGHEASAAGAAPSTATRSGGFPLNALLAFLSGMLLMALGGVGLLLWQRNGNLALTPSTNPSPAMPAAPPASASAPVPGPTAPAPVGTTTVPPSTPAEDSAATGNTESPSGDSDRAAVDRSVASIQELYSALSTKNFDQARNLFGAAAADQFEPDFFRQFERVTVQNLTTTSRSGSTVNLEGEVNFVYPDGSIQTETRTFSVDSSSEPARITASEFGRVIKPR
ncbi:MAG: hypothetical protein ACKOXO_10095 [Cyanobium sp.]